ncbi:flagellar hook-length control protein FliK [Desulfomarina sp.]
MTQTAFIQALPKTPQSAPSPSPQAQSSEKGEFNTHLEKAVSRMDEKKESHTNDRKENSGQPEDTPETAQQTPAPAMQDQHVETESINNIVLSRASNSIEKSPEKLMQAPVADQSAKVSVQSELQQNIFLQDDDNFLHDTLKLRDEQVDTLTQRELQAGKLQPAVLPEQKLNIDIKAGPEQQPATSTPQQNTSENKGLFHLQQVIAAGNEMGTVSIQGTVAGVSLQKTEQPVLLKTAQPESPVKTPQLRQDIHGQFLETKLNLNNHKDNEPGRQGENPAGNSNQLQTGPGNSLENSVHTVDQTGELQTFSTVLQTVRPDTTGAVAKPVTLPNGTVVYENKVMDQVVDHFRMHRTVHDSKITIKLHPAELGELKIDIAMKEGNIKAHVIAQNQQVQDIVEKNMLKLRTVLEDQGFSLTDITVSTDSDSVADFNFFDQHLSQQNDRSQETISAHQQDNFTQVLEDAVGVVETGQYLSGVNITA